MDSRSSVLVKNTGWVIIGKVFSQLFTLVASVLVIRKLDIEVYGVYNFVLGLMVVFNLLGVSPVIDVFNRYIPELIEKGDKKRFSKLLIYGISIAILSSVIIAMLISIFQVPFANFFNIDSFSQYIKAFYLYVFLNLFRLLIQSILASTLLHNFSSIFLIFTSLLRSVLYIALLKYLTVNFLLYIEAFVCFIYTIMGLTKVYSFNRSIRIVENSTHFDQPVNRKRILRFGIFTSLNQLGSGIVGRTSDFYIISAMSNLYNVGLYSFATRVYEMIFRLLPIEEFRSVLRPLFFQKFSGQSDNNELNLMYSFIIKVVFPIFALPLCYFIVFGHEVITFVFDPKYMAAYAITCITIADNIIMGYFYPLQLVVQLKERMEIALFSKIAVVFSIVAGIYFMKIYGIIGVAIATVIGNLLKNLIMFFPMRKMVGLRANPLMNLNYFIVLACSGLIFYFTKSLITNIFILLLVSILFMGFTFCLLLIFHPFSPREIEYLNKMGDANKISRTLKSVITKFYRLPIIRLKK